jgi:hypothetical protein
VILTVTVLALVGLVAWYWMAREGQPPAPAPEPVAVAAPRPATAPPAPSGPVPPLSESEPRVRELLGSLSSEPELARWLGAEGLVQRFATAVSNIADGDSPGLVLSFLGPSEKFQVARRDGRTVIEPRGFERYDAVARVFGSIDAQAAVRVYGELKPLIERAYSEIAPPGKTFDRTFARALQHLLAVPVPPDDVELVERGALFVYADPRLEGLSRAQKHLLRMGPKNVQRIQAKLTELQGALNLPIAGR